MGEYFRRFSDENALCRVYLHTTNYSRESDFSPVFLIVFLESVTKSAKKQN